MQTKHVRSDLGVIGGGLSGVAAAIAAAREGLSVTLVQDRPVLGGNSSSEVRLWPLGAIHSGVYTRFARDGGIMEELYLENMHRNQDANPVLWDPLLYEWVTREGITLLLDTAAYRVSQNEDGRILNVSAFSSQNETEYIIHAPVFVDATGDGIVGFLAGADYRTGREGRSEFNEDMAPDIPDTLTLGHTITFKSVDVGHPVPFVKPAFALDLEKTSILKHRRLDEKVTSGDLWWLEYGGMLDTIHDTHEIKRHLWEIVYGAWDYIKNSGKFDAENLTLEWAGLVPGKRESRRFVGDYILNANDCLDQVSFSDSIAAGGWSLDLHPSKGLYSPEPPCTQECMEGVYDIPYRCLYSHNVPNLFVAGRNISASHVAFGSTRVMATCAAMGQAVGVAASLCIRENCPPRNCADGNLIQELRQTLLREGQYIPNAVNDDPTDQAPYAVVSSSSTALLAETRDIDSSVVALDRVRGLMIPVASDRLDEILLRVDAETATELVWSCMRNEKLINYVPETVVSKGSTPIDAGTSQWVSVPVNADIDEPQNLWLILEPNKKVSLHTTRDRLTGVLTVGKGEHRNRPHWPVEPWNLTFRLNPAQPCWSEQNIIDGHSRPRIMPHIWVSEPMKPGQPEWINLKWSESRQVREVKLYLNSDLSRKIYTVHRPSDCRAVPELPRDIHIDVKSGNGEWARAASVRENHQRVVSIPLGGIVTDEMRVVIDNTNGHDRAEVFEVRVY